MARGKATTVTAVILLAAAWGWLYLWAHPRPPGIDRRLHQAVGETLAAEALQQLQAGGRLIVLARDPRAFEVPAAAAQLDGFLRALKRARRQVTAFRPFKLDPLRPLQVPPGEFFDLLRAGREDDVMVSFLGPPLLDAGQVARLGPKRPRVLALCSGALPSRVDLKRLFEQQLLAAAVVSRPDAPARPGPGSKQQAFEQMFRLITPANLADLPAPSRARL